MKRRAKLVETVFLAILGLIALFVAVIPFVNLLLNHKTVDENWLDNISLLIIGVPFLGFIIAYRIRYLWARGASTMDEFEKRTSDAILKLNDLVVEEGETVQKYDNIVFDYKQNTISFVGDVKTIDVNIATITRIKTDINLRSPKFEMILSDKRKLRIYFVDSIEAYRGIKNILAKSMVLGDGVALVSSGKANKASYGQIAGSDKVLLVETWLKKHSIKAYKYRNDRNARAVLVFAAAIVGGPIVIVVLLLFLGS